MKTLVYLSGLLLLLSSNKSFAQDPIFLNTNQSLIYLNPSFAGSNGLIRNQFHYRNQWPNLSSSLVTLHNSFDAYIKPIKGAIAVSWMHDDVLRGQLQTNSFNLTYAQHFNLFSKTVKFIPSVQLGYTNKVADLNSYHFGDVIDPRLGYSWSWGSVIAPVQRKSYLDISTGFLMKYKNDFYFGGYFFHINQPDAGVWGAHRLPMTIQLHSSYTFHFNETNLLQVFSRFSHQGNYSMLQISANAILMKHLIVGAGYRNGNSYLFNMGFRNDFFTVQAGSDVVVSKLSGKTGPSWEVGVSFNLRPKEMRRGVVNFESM